jgi:hypothetical protein
LQCMAFERTNPDQPPTPPIRGVLRTELVRDLALGAETHAQLAEKYGRSTQAVHQFATQSPHLRPDHGPSSTITTTNTTRDRIRSQLGPLSLLRLLDLRRLWLPPPHPVLLPLPLLRTGLMALRQRRFADLVVVQVAESGLSPRPATRARPDVVLCLLVVLVVFCFFFWGV